MPAVRFGVFPRALLFLLAGVLSGGSPAQAELPDFKPIIQGNLASVVNISTTQD